MNLNSCPCLDGILIVSDGTPASVPRSRNRAGIRGFCRGPCLLSPLENLNITYLVRCIASLSRNWKIWIRSWFLNVVDDEPDIVSCDVEYAALAAQTKLNSYIL